MGEIEEFLKNGSGSGDGFGFGSGFGDGSGFGSGFGDGSGFGSGFGDGSGSGDGSGNGDVNGIKSFCGKEVYLIDDMQTIIESVRGNIAKGYILQSDLTLTPCHVVKENGKVRPRQHPARSLRGLAREAIRRQHRGGTPAKVPRALP